MQDLRACQYLCCTTMPFLRQACMYVYKFVYKIENATHTYVCKYVHTYVTPQNGWAYFSTRTDVP